MALLVNKQRLLNAMRGTLLCAIAAVALAVVLEWLQVTTQPNSIAIPRDEDSGITALNMDVALLTLCAHQNGSIIVADRPAQITFNLKEAQTMDSVLISTDRISGPYIVRVLYAVPGEKLSVDQSTQMTATGGQGLMILDIPRGDYDKLAVQVAGSLAVTAIEYSPTDQFTLIPEPSAMNVRRIAKLSMLLLLLFLLLTYLGFWRCLIALPGRIVKKVRSFDRNALNALLIFIGTGTVAYLLARLLVLYYVKKDINWITNIFCIFFAISAGSIFSFRKTLGEKPEIFFVIFALLTGTLLSFFAPDSAGVSWDDGFHSANAVQYSYLGEERLTRQDIKSINDHSYVEYDLNKLDQWHDAQDELHQKGALSISNSSLYIGYHWSITQGVGLYLGRILRLPYWIMWSMGRFTGLLAYALIGYFAIRRLHSGKMIMVSALMIPEAIFLASQYSYDPAVTAFLALGMSYCFAEWQEINQTITWKNAIIMIGALFLGCLVKAIYFPLFLIPIFFPKEKFENRKQRKRFIMLSLVAMIAIILYFMIPFLTGDGSGDSRGGGDVNAFMQVSFILHNPLRYAQILLQFLRAYLGSNSAGSRLCSFAYLGQASLAYIYWGMMIAVCFTDRSEMELALTNRKWVRALALFFLFGTMCLVATALYVSFTAVGSETIAGCQPRYLHPVIFPAMMLLGSGRIVNKANRTLYNGILFAIIGYVNYVAVLSICLVNYT